MIMKMISGFINHLLLEGAPIAGEASTGQAAVAVHDESKDEGGSCGASLQQRTNGQDARLWRQEELA